MGILHVKAAPRVTFFSLLQFDLQSHATREVPMHSPFDMLKKNRKRSFCRFEAVDDLACANLRIRELIASFPGE